jgi:hypothetical protein
MADEIKGLRELRKKLKALPKSVQGRTLSNATRSSLLPAEKLAKATIPVGTESHVTYRGTVVEPGFSKSQIRREVWRSPNGAYAIARLGVRPEAFYAVQFVELGVPAYGIPPRPWLAPALEQSQRLVVDRLKDRLSKSIEKAAKKR